MKRYLYIVLTFVIIALGFVAIYRNISFDTLDTQQFSYKHNPKIQLIHAGRESKRKKVISKIIKSSVRIESLFKDKVGLVGTGVLIEINDVKLLLTAHHVIKQSFPMPMRACSLTKNDCIHLYPNFILNFDLGGTPVIFTDWAILKLDILPDGTSPIQISPKKINVGDPIWMIGMPWGRSPWISNGNIAWKTGIKKGASLLYINGFAAPGFSGGGVFDDEGDLIAITVAVVQTAKGLQVNQALAVPLSNIWPLLFNE